MSVPIDIAIRVLVAVATIIALTRLHGLRSFSKMSGFDFAITVAVGSILAGAVTTLSTPLWHFILALIAIFALQIVMAQLRARSEKVETTLDNPPLLIMENGKAILDNLEKGGMTESDLMGKLREANAFDLDHVHAVVLESTGDVSVLHGAPDGPRPDPQVMEGVRHF